MCKLAKVLLHDLKAVDSSCPPSVAGNTPQETYEKHAHNVHDHDENETYERRNVG